MKKQLRQLATIVALFSAVVVEAEVQLPNIFSSNMVLQRDKAITVWGTADSGEKVAVKFNGKRVTAVADQNGQWKVTLPAMPHGGPFALEVTGKDNAVILDNVLIGDVWLCSGQSNMEFGLNSALTGEEEIPRSGNEMIRLFTVPKVIHTQEQYDAGEAMWWVCGPESSAGFSAVGYFFGKRLQEKLDVPIGLINSSWGGTDIETWTSWEASMQNSEYAGFSGRSLEEALGYTMEDVRRFNADLKNDPAIKDKWYDPASSVEGWKQMEVPKTWDGAWGQEDGIIWFRKTIELPADAAGAAGVIHLGPIDDEDVTWINGERVGSMGFWMAERTYEIKPGILKAGENHIVVQITDTAGAGGMYGQADQLFLEVKGSIYPLAGMWACKPSVLSSSYGFQTRGNGPNSFASLLYNGMIHPLVGYGITGVIWYQGENNAGDAFRYRTLFPNMINDWRNQWGDEFPFLWVQLASFMAEAELPKESEWAELREAQNMTLHLPKTGQAVITDIGEAFDIHPRNKRDVGLRLAHAALKVAYGQDVLPSGPVFEHMELQGERIILTFSRIGNGLSTLDGGPEVKGFAIAGEDQHFVWADAQIRDNQVEVFCDAIKTPVAVRYGWADNPIQINLINSDGLLASPFRTDSWKGLTEK